MGKSTDYTAKEREKIEAHVLAELSAGNPISRTLNAEREPWLCCERTWWNWYYQADADDKNGLVQKVARARDCGVEAMVDKAVMVANTPMMGKIRRDKPVIFEGEVTDRTYEETEEDMLGHRKLVVDTHFKAAQMLKPKTYGAKLDLTSGGEKLGLSAELEAARKRTAAGETNG